jgi:hypothetical protein
MTSWICTRCHQEALSKCVDERNIFTKKPIGERVDCLVLENLTDITFTPDDQVLLTLHCVEDVHELWERLALLARQPQYRLTQLACKHEYHLADASVCVLGHTHHLHSSLLP